MASRLKRKKTSPLVRVLKVLYIMLVIVSVVIVGAFAAYQVFVGPPDVAEQVTFPITTSPQPSQDVVTTQEPEATPSDDVVVYTRQKGVYTCLLLGVADMGGSDTIMLGCFDTNNKTASLISIPRDTLVEHDGKNSKINAIYNYRDGGAEGMARKVSELLGVPVDYYMSVDLEAFEKIVRLMKESGIGYGSINHPVDRDPVCGYNGVIGDACPNCGRHEDDVRFERIRRITGYLVGTLDRFNNAKRAEEHDRVKHQI